MVLPLVLQATMDLEWLLQLAELLEAHPLVPQVKDTHQDIPIPVDPSTAMVPHPQLVQVAT